MGERKQRESYRPVHRGVETAAWGIPGERMSSDRTPLWLPLAEVGLIRQ